MQANWSLILNILMLVGVFIAIGRVMKSRRQRYQPEQDKPSLGSVDALANDDIISVKKVDPALFSSPETDKTKTMEPSRPKVSVSPQGHSKPEQKKFDPSQCTNSVMIFLLAKENRQFAGYDLLQTLLSTGLRFGDGQLFHRHQYANGQGPVLCTLAAATPSGIFDMQSIGAFSARGLCLFMEASNNTTIDSERFSIMLDTARQLSESLDCYLLDDERKPLNDRSIERYYRLLKIEESESVC